jgi:hypothetical protein
MYCVPGTPTRKSSLEIGAAEHDENFVIRVDDLSDETSRVIVVKTAWIFDQ